MNTTTLKTVYKVANKKKFGVTITHEGAGRWSFKVGQYTYTFKLRGGNSVAKVVGDTIRKAWLRNEGISDASRRLDDAARDEINRLTGVRTLADYQMPNWF